MKKAALVMVVLLATTPLFALDAYPKTSIAEEGTVSARDAQVEIGSKDPEILVLDDVIGHIFGRDLVTNGVAGVYSVPRVGARASEHGLAQGWALDLLTGWDLTASEARRKARELLDRSKPKLLVGSPVCTYFSTIMAWNWPRMNPEEAKKKWREAVLHLNFAIELYQAQLDSGRLFLHEHPLGASSWRLPRMAELMQDARTIKITTDQCMLGQWTRSERGS